MSKLVETVRGTAWAIAGTIALAIGCSHGDERVHVVDVPDGTYLRGDQVAKLEIDPRLEVVHAELYLDGQRVAADEFAPFELAWDTRGFADGPHRLTARVYLVDEQHVDGTTAVVIDNTPPRIDSIPTTAAGPQPFLIGVSDNLKVARVEVTRDRPGEEPIVLTAKPFGFSWRWGCGTSTVHIRVFDAAGGEASGSAEVTATDLDDLDCDGFTSTTAGGTDCNDFNALAHPGAPEPPEGYDVNCDGKIAPLAGIDSDGDGVPSVADGGSDCDDTDPTVFGAYYLHAHVAVTVGGVPVTWNPGEAVLDGSSSNWRLYLDRGGVITQYTQDFNGEIVTELVTTGANPSSLSARNGTVAFGRGNDVVIARRDLGGWVERVITHAAAPVGRLLADQVFSGNTTEFVAYQAGTELWLATSVDGGAWTTERIDNLREPLLENPAGHASTNFAAFVVRTAHAVWRYDRFSNTAFQQVRVGPADKLPVAMSGDLGTLLVAVDDGGGSAIYRDGLTEPLLRTGRVVAMTASYPSVFVQLATGVVQVYLPTGFGTTLRTTQILTGISQFDTGSSGALAGGGTVHYLSGMMSSAIDPPDDHVDRNCDEHD